MSTSAHQHICHDPLQSARTDSSFHHSGLGKTSQNECCFSAYYVYSFLAFPFVPEIPSRICTPPNEPRMNIGSHASSCSVASHPLTTSSSFACLIFTSFDVHDQTTSATPMLTLQPRKRTPFDASTPSYTDFILTTFASPSACLYLPHQTRRPYFSLVNSAVAPQPHHDSISILHSLYHFHLVQHNQTTFP